MMCLLLCFLRCEEALSQPFGEANAYTEADTTNLIRLVLSILTLSIQAGTMLLNTQLADEVATLRTCLQVVP